MVPIMRRIDELGRIVIPKDIRKKLRFLEDDILELKIENNKLIISKNNNDNEYIKYIEGIVNNLYKIIKNNIVITNNDVILSYKLQFKYNFKQEKLNDEFINKILNRNKIKENGKMNITNNLILDGYYIFKPIIINSNLRGSIIYFKNDPITDIEEKLIDLSTMIISNYIDC